MRYDTIHTTADGEPHSTGQEAVINPFSILPKHLPHIHFSRVTSDTSYNHYGAVSSPEFIEEGSGFVTDNSNASQSEVKATLENFFDICKSNYVLTKGGEAPLEVAAWLTIRMTFPTHDFDMPRWHRDGRMYEADQVGDINHKYATTLLGNPTRVLEASELVQEVMSMEHDRDYDRQRKTCAEALAREQPLHIQAREIIRFSWGQDDSPVHSEPEMKSDRVFLSIVFGSENEIRSLCTFRKQIYKE